MEVSSLPEEQRSPGSSSFWKITLVASIAAGLQFGWALQLSLLTPYVQLLGVRHQWAAFIWLCGPVSGMLVQPTVGYFSDRCTSRFGRRRPFIVGGALFVVIAVFLIGFAADIGHRAGDSLHEEVKQRAVLVFVVGFWILDVANNMLQGPCRAFLADLAGGNSSVTRRANALFSFFMGLGNVGGYSAGSLKTLYKAFPFTKTVACDTFCANLKSCFFISVTLLLTLTFLAVLFVKEEPWSRSGQTNDEEDKTASSPFFGELSGAFRSMKKPMWLLLMVTCLNWVAWFPFLLYDTDWMGREVYGGDPNGKAQLKKLYDHGVRSGALGLLLNSVVLGFFSLGIEPIGRGVGGVNKLWGIVNMILATGLAFTVLVTKLAQRYRRDALAGGATFPPLPSAGIKGAALAIFSVLGIPLAITFSVPFALASIFSNASGAGQGLSLGVLNLSIVLPQMFVSVTSGPWDALFGGGNLPAFVVGAVAAAVSGTLAMFILPSPSPDIRPSTATVAFH